MKTATKTGAKREVLTSDDVQRMIAEAAASTWDKRLNLQGCTIASIELKNCDVPVSLDFDGATILGDVLVSNVKFTGSYIGLDDAVVKGCVILAGLGEHKFSLFLRCARVGSTGTDCNVHEAVHLCSVSLNALCIGGLRIERGPKKIGVRDVTFESVISLDPTH